MTTFIMLLVLLLQGGPGGSESVGSLPKTLVMEPGPCFGSSKVKPGGSALNNDGVGVEASSTSQGDATLSPGDGQGTASCASNAVTRNGFEGAISGIDLNDTVSVGANNTTSVTGTGGYVSLAGHSTTTVSNTGTTNNITVVLPSGQNVTVPPQTSQTFTT
jgi:hypothetical protein